MGQLDNFRKEVEALWADETARDKNFRALSLRVIETLKPLLVEAIRGGFHHDDELIKACDCKGFHFEYLSAIQGLKADGLIHYIPCYGWYIGSGINIY